MKGRILSRVRFAIFLGLLNTAAWAINSDANCEGWAAFFDPMPSHHYQITATLWVLDSGTYHAIAEEVRSQTLYEPGPLYVGDFWPFELPTGSYRVTFFAEVTPLADPYGYSVDLTPAFFNCTSTTPVEARTPGYWKNHPKAWPVSELELGVKGNAYSIHCLLGVLNLPTRGDVRIKLIHHLIAAKLNLLSGTDPAPISATIASSDQYLTDSGSLPDRCSSDFVQGSKPGGSERAMVVRLKDALDAYNNNYQ